MMVYDKYYVKNKGKPSEKSFILKIEDKEVVHLKILMQNFMHQIIMMWMWINIIKILEK